MALNEQKLESILRERIKGVTELIVEDHSGGCGSKFACIIVSSEFEGKPLLARHRMVNDALAEEMKDIHAFSMKTLTPEQFAKKKAEEESAAGS